MDDDERQELLGRLFYLMTALLEDAAQQAAEGQGGGLTDAQRETMVRKVRSAGEAVTIISDATVALLRVQSAAAAA